MFYIADSGALAMSDGFQSYERVSPVRLVLYWVSLGLGILGLLWFLLVGLIGGIRYRAGFLRRPEAPAAVASLLLIVPVPLFATQSFMALGDLTPASAVLALVTLLLPAGMLLTFLRSVRGSGLAARIQGAAALIVLQWCGVLAANAFLPLRLWI